MSTNTTVVLCFGSLSERKGLEALLKAANEPSFPNSVHLLLAGKQDKSAQTILSDSLGTELRNAGRLYEINRYLSHDEEAVVFAASDVVWMGYVTHFQMSGVLVQAGAFGLPVIACEEGLIGWLTSRYSSGIVVPVEKPTQVAAAIAKLVSSPGDMERLGKNGNSVFAQHTLDNAQSILRASVSCAR